MALYFWLVTAGIFILGGLTFRKLRLHFAGVRRTLMISKSIQKIIIKQLHNEIKDIELIVLFGSASNGDYIQYKSDIDIAFLSSSTVSNLQCWETQEKLASLLNSDIDLVDLRNSDDVFRFEITSKGKNIFIKPSSKIEQFLDSIYINYIQLNEDRAEVMQAFQ